RERTIAEAIDGLERHTPIRRRFTELDAKRAFEPFGKRFASHALAGFGPADLDHVPAVRLPAEVVIEADHALHVGTREVQHIGNDDDGLVVDMAETVIDRMQDWEQRTLEPDMLCNQRFGALYIPRFISRHGVMLRCFEQDQTATRP